ncbi:oxygenase MpaB family protein [Nonomuraea ferruginea]
MDKPSRRNVLKAGGALGALGALSATTPAYAWTWSPKGSVAGTGVGADPRWVWDAEADPLVASLLDRGDVPLVNRLLRNWTKNGQPLPDGLPADLRAFMEDARRLPAWTDHGKLATSFRFTEKRGLYLGVLYGMASGMMSTVIPREARAVYYSQGGADMKDRITKTAKLGYDIMTRNAFAPRRRDDRDLRQDPAGARRGAAPAAAVPVLAPPVADEEIPISQADMMVTWHSLGTTVMQKMLDWRVPIPSSESTDFLHSWQLTAHMLGIRDEYIPASWAQANSQAEQVLTPILAPTPPRASSWPTSCSTSAPRSTAPSCPSRSSARSPATCSATR